MPKVPTLNGNQFSVAPNVGADPQFDPASNAPSETAGAAPGAQLEKFGDAVQGFGQTEANINVDALNTVNQVQVSNAMNMARQRALDLTYGTGDPNDPNATVGYQSLKGGQALQRPDGQALPEEYGQKLSSSISDISDGLGNDAQKRMFQLQSGELQTNFTGDVEKHMLGEFRDYHMSVAKGQGELSTQEATLNWDNPQKIDQAINGVQDPAHPDDPAARTGGLKQSIYQQALVSGMSANEAVAAMNAQVSKIHATVIDSAIANNNPTYATAYFSQNKQNMTGDDILQVQGKLNHAVDTSTALGATNATATKFATAFAPTDMDRLHGVVQSMESNGRETDASGNVITSPKGAQGSMQVMPATQTDPGFGVKPANLTGDPVNDAAERSRVGRDYMDAMLKRYGNVGQALAAYNAGPGKVDDAIAQAKTAGDLSSYTQYLPQETQDYVSTGMKRFNAGAGAPPVPTKSDFVGDAITRLGPNPRVEAVQMTREQAEAQYKLISESRAEQADQSLAQAQKELIANGGDFSQLQPTTVSNLSRYDPGKYDDALKFAKSISQGENTTNVEAYATAYAHPEELTKMTDTQFAQFAKTNFSTDDAEKISRLRAEALTGKNGTGADSLNNSVVTQTLNNRLASIGIDPKPKASDMTSMTQVANIQKFVRDDIYEQQRQLGRKMNPEEVSDRINTLFSMPVNTPHWYGDSSKPLPSLQLSDVPSTAVTNIRSAFTARGVNNPSDAAILEAYQNWKKRNG